MASRYWVGGTANWDATAGTKWSTTSGGAGGAAVPTTADDVFFDANSGSGVVTISATANCLTLDASAFAGSITHNAVTLTVAGTLFKLKTSADGWTAVASSVITFTSTGSVSIDTSGKTLGSVTLNGAGGVFTLASALTNLATSTLTLTAGHFDANDFDVNVGAFDSSNSNTRTLSMGNGNWYLSSVTDASSVWTTATYTNLTFNKEGANITISGKSGIRSFSGTGRTFNNLTIVDQSAAAVISLIGTMTFAELSMGAWITITFSSTCTFSKISSPNSRPDKPIGLCSNTFGVTRSITLQSAGQKIKHAYLSFLIINSNTLTVEGGYALRATSNISMRPPGARTSFQLGI